MKLQEIGQGKYLLYLPKALVDGLDWKKGQELEAKILGKDRIEIRKPQ